MGDPNDDLTDEMMREKNRTIRKNEKRHSRGRAVFRDHPILFLLNSPFGRVFYRLLPMMRSILRKRLRKSRYSVSAPKMERLSLISSLMELSRAIVRNFCVS